MRRIAMTSLAFVVVGSTLALGSQPTDTASPAAPTVAAVRPAPPIRPAALTASQYQVLKRVEAMPEHSRVLDTTATYSAREKNLQFTRFTDDALTVAYDVGWPGMFLTFLMLSAPFAL